MNTANSAPKTTALKTRAVTKVDVDALEAFSIPDLCRGTDVFSFQLLLWPQRQGKSGLHYDYGCDESGSQRNGRNKRQRRRKRERRERERPGGGGGGSLPLKSLIAGVVF